MGKRLSATLVRVLREAANGTLRHGCFFGVVSYHAENGHDVTRYVEALRRAGMLSFPGVEVSAEGRAALDEARAPAQATAEEIRKLREDVQRLKRERYWLRGAVNEAIQAKGYLLLGERDDAIECLGRMESAVEQAENP